MSSLDEILDYYSRPGPLTDASEHGRALEELPEELGPLVTTIQGLAIYDVVASDFYGVGLSEERAAAIHRRSVDDILDGLAELDRSPLSQTRPPARRLPMRCAGFTKLVVSALRSRGVPARARCGFATYFNPDGFEDHWVAEVWDAAERRWRLVDAQLDAEWRSRLDLDDDILDVPRESFLVAAEAWQRCRSGDADPERFGISFAGLHGQAFIAGNLVRDLAALNKVEMLPWDVWGAQPAPDAQLDSAEFDHFDELARLTLDPDARFAAIRARYEDDERVRMPGYATNALRGEREAVPL